MLKIFFAYKLKYDPGLRDVTLFENPVIWNCAGIEQPGFL